MVNVTFIAFIEVNKEFTFMKFRCGIVLPLSILLFLCLFFLRLFSCLLQSAKSLQTLRLPRSEISNSIVEQVAGMLSGLTFLDVSYCKNIGAQALEAIGKNCKSLSGLRRIMHPLEVIDKLSQDDEAIAIASTMPKLRHLEIAYLLVDTSSVLEIIRNCRELELLDIRGCWNVSLDENFVKKFSKLKIIGPHIMDYYDIDNWDSCSDYSSSSDFLDWDLFADDMDDNDDDEDYEDVSDGFWEDDERIEDIEMWFYDDLEAIDAGYDWPQSP